MYPGAHVDHFPDKPAVVLAESGTALTYRELEDNSVRLARHLYDAGLRKGDHIALLSGNTLEVYEVYWAALRSGLYITAVNRHLSADEISYIVNDCGARALIVWAELADVAQRVVEQTPEVEIRLAFGGDVHGYESYEKASAAASSEPLPDQPRGADMLYSSGTTGRPKGISIRCRIGRSAIRRATPTPPSSARSTDSTPTPSTCRRRRCITPRRCGSAAWFTPSAEPWW